MRSITLLVVAILALGALSGCAPTKIDTPAVSESVAPLVVDTAKADFIAMKSAYLVGRPDDRWLISSASDIRSEEQFKLLEEVGKTFAHHVERALSAGSEVSPLANEIANRFKKIEVGLYLEAEQRTAPLFMRKDVSSGKAGFCLFPADGYLAIPTTVSYNSDMGMVMMRALKYPEPAFAGMVFHELGHNLWALKDKPSSFASQDSEEWATEEVVMNELDMQITNHLTGGKWFGYIDKFITSHPSDSVRDLIFQVKLEDMKAMDKIDGSDSYGSLAVAHTMAMRIFAIAFRWVDKTHKESSKEEILAAKVQAFREADSLITSTF